MVGELNQWYNNQKERIERMYACFICRESVEVGHMRGRAISYFLMDGTANGRIQIRIKNRSPLAFKISKADMEKSKDMEELKKSGIYLLVGKSVDDSDTIYVGQAGFRSNSNGLYQRMNEPHETIDWTYAIAITSSADDLGATELNYLENKLYSVARDTDRFVLTNKNTPATGKITDETQAYLDEFAEDVVILVGALGCFAFIPVDDKKAEETPIMRMNYNGVTAAGRMATDGFILLKGSRICPTETQSCPNFTHLAREKYKDKVEEGTNKLKEDIFFTSLTAAAQFVAGASVSGPSYWKNQEV